jgi:hypothetical protein
VFNIQDRSLSLIYIFKEPHRYQCAAHPVGPAPAIPTHSVGWAVGAGPRSAARSRWTPVEVERGPGARRLEPLRSSATSSAPKRACPCRFRNQFCYFGTDMRQYLFNTPGSSPPLRIGRRAEQREFHGNDRQPEPGPSTSLGHRDRQRA